MYSKPIKIKSKDNNKVTVSLRTSENSVIVVEVNRKDLEKAISEYRAELDS